MVVFQIILLLFSIYAFVQAASFSFGSCQASCGDVNIKYPFGIGAADCYADNSFEVVCNNDSLGASPKPFLRSLNLEVLNISLEGTVRVNYPTFFSCTNGSSSAANIVNLANSSFVFSQSENRFIAMGCNNFASMESVESNSSGSVIGGCMSICDTSKVVNASSCNGINCCQTTIPSHLVAFNATIEAVDSLNCRLGNCPRQRSFNIQDCKYAFLVEETWFQKHGSDNITFREVPVALEWGLPYTSIANNTSSNSNCTEFLVSNANRNATTFTCSCEKGFEGNPYLLGGCHGKVFVPLPLSFSFIIFFFSFSFLLCI
jgi:hypothetical protein